MKNEKKEEIDPYEEIFKILQSYDEGFPPRKPDAEECGCMAYDAENESEDS
tara:strand:+ start:524 stop:676 length:153 start_codon:yes stop_codon:yes gene_type:complete